MNFLLCIFWPITALYYIGKFLFNAVWFDLFSYGPKPKVRPPAVTRHEWEAMSVEDARRRFPWLFSEEDAELPDVDEADAQESWRQIK